MARRAAASRAIAAKAAADAKAALSLGLRPTLGRRVPQFRGWGLSSFNISTKQSGDTLTAPPPPAALTAAAAAATASGIPRLACAAPLSIHGALSETGGPEERRNDARGRVLGSGRALGSGGSSSSHSSHAGVSRNHPPPPPALPPAATVSCSLPSSSSSTSTSPSRRPIATLPSPRSTVFTPGAGDLAALAPPLPLPKLIALLGLKEKDAW